MDAKHIDQLTDWEKESLSSQKEVLLYKYRGNIHRDILTIRNNQIYIPKMDELNDPNESCISLHSVLETIKLMKNAVETAPTFFQPLSEIKKGITRSEDEIKRIKDKNGYFSLCKRNNIECLWAYYANGHKGFCIEYDLIELQKTINYNNIYEVQYTNDRTNPNYNEVSEMIEKEPNKLLRGLTASKSRAWMQEEEVRIVTKNCGYVDITPNAVKSIYIGVKCSDKDLIINSLKGMNIKFYQMNLNHDSFSMSSKLIDI